MENRTPSPGSVPLSPSGPTRALASRDRILDVAESLFARGGFEGLGMRELATRVGLGKSSLFHHFPTKRELYAEVLDRVLERIDRALAEGGAGRGRPIEGLEAWIETVVATLAQDADAARLMMRALVDEEPFAVVRLDATDRELWPFEIRLSQIVGEFRTLLEEGIEAGIFRPVAVGDAVQSVIGTLVFHFASGDLGEALIGEPSASGSAIERRQSEVTAFIRGGLLA